MVRQVDHQDQCALMADGWGTDGFTRPEPFGPIREAARLHDEGWRSWEERPEVTDSGRPVDFPQLDRRTHIALYTAGIDIACKSSDRVGLIVSMHGQGLYERRLGLDGPIPPRGERPEHERAFIAQELERQARLTASIGTPRTLTPWAWSAYRLLQVWDALSLFLLWKALSPGAETVIERVPRHADDHRGVPLTVSRIVSDTATIEPYPFSRSPFELPVAARWIENRPYVDDGDLQDALESASWVTAKVRVSES